MREEITHLDDLGYDEDIGPQARTTAPSSSEETMERMSKNVEEALNHLKNFSLDSFKSAEGPTPVRTIFSSKVCPLFPENSS